MPNIFFYFFSFLVVIGVLVFVHEFGHYLAARLVNVKVLRFSIGFGPVLLKWLSPRSGTEWVLSAIPLGGYVKMLDGREVTLSDNEKPEAFDQKSLIDRCFVVVAGPLANFLIAIFFYFLLNLSGGFEIRSYLGKPDPASFAEIHGVKEKDLVLSINDQPINTWSDFNWFLINESQNYDSLTIVVRDTEGLIKSLKLDSSSLLTIHEDPVFLRKLGFVAYQPEYPALIGQVLSDSVADKAGLKVGDLVVQVNDLPVQTWRDFVGIVRKNPSQEITLVIEQQENKAQYKVVLTPESVTDATGTFGKIGVSLSPEAFPDLNNKIFIQYPPFLALKRACVDTYDQAALTLKMFWKMLIGQVSVKNISGPLTIADYAGQSAKMGGEYYLRFMALVSISLAVLNLLPIPVLDGGHLMYYLLEGIRGKPLSDAASAKFQRAGLAFILMMMSLALFNDLNRLFFG